jgi:hypothetical protein
MGRIGPAEGFGEYEISAGTEFDKPILTRVWRIAIAAKEYASIGSLGKDLAIVVCPLEKTSGRAED